MVTDNHYRWDFIQLSTDVKPTPATSNKVTDGSTLYTSDDSKLYIWYKDQWYEKEATGGGSSYTAGDGIDITDNEISVDTTTIQEKLTASTGIDITDNDISVDTTTIQEKLTAGTGIDITDNTISATGGGGPTVVQTTGTSTTDVMSQNATTGMVRTATGNNIKIGESSSTNKTGNVVIGDYAQNEGQDNVVIGGATSTSTRIGNVGIRYVIIGSRAKSQTSTGTSTYNAVALGVDSYAKASESIALGAGAIAQSQGEMNIGTSNNHTGQGYNSSDYRLLTGLYDPQNDHDAATKGYIDSLISALEARIAALEGN